MIRLRLHDKFYVILSGVERTKIATNDRGLIQQHHFTCFVFTIIAAYR